MIEAPAPQREAQRLGALRALHILDTEPEERFDRIASLATTIFGVPIALVSLIDEHRQWFKSCVGVDLAETDRSISFCGHAVAADQVLVVPDALEDERFVDNPLVTGPPGVRFYAGVPVHAPGTALAIGTLCIIDRVPRQLTDRERTILVGLAVLVEAEFAITEERRGLWLYEAVLRAATGHCIFATDASGVISIFNSGAERLLGWRADELIGHATPARFLDRTELASQMDRAVGMDPIVAVRELVGEGIPHRLHFLTREGTRVPVLVTFTVNHDRNDQPVGLIGIATDISSQVATEERLASNERLFRTILKHINDGVVVIDRQGIVRYASSAAMRLVGAATIQDALGRPIFDYLHPDDVAEAAESLERQSKHSGEGDPLYVRVVRPDGDERDTEAVAYTLLDDPAVQGIVLTIRDITERRALERMQNQFVSAVSHELRTPLTSIKGSLGLILGGVAGELPEQAVHLVEVAARNSDVLMQLVNDILDIERLDADAMILERADTPIAEVVHQALDAVAGMAIDRGVEIETHGIDATVVPVDGFRIAQALTNLLGNAVKFSPSGSTVRVEQVVAPDSVTISVVDSGPGIPADQRESIFERFEQVRGLNGVMGGGTGLGLPIARGIVEAHGGTITAESAVGVGSRFVIRLPRGDGS